jgi:ATP-dependent DNA ligase
MDLPVMPPIAPMLSKPQADLPTGDEWVYEPKWDGFRTIVFKDGDEVELGSRNEKPMTRYFPEVCDALRAALPSRCVVDGEIVVVDADGRLAFDTLQNRIHPAASRVKMLAAETPAAFVAFDLLALDDRDLRTLPFAERRALLVASLAAQSDVNTDDVRVTPATADRTVAADWFTRFEGLGCDGIIAKRVTDPYVEDKRIMVKVKHQRTADCVVAGFRWHKSGGIVGSLLLGLFGDDGQLHHVGVTASFTMKRRAELVAELEPYRSDLEGHPWSGWIEHIKGVEEGGQRTSDGAVAGELPAERSRIQRLPGGQSRWNAKKDLSFEPVRAELVCEVAFDHLEGDRFRHAATFVRWRPDRIPLSCTYEQMDTPVRATISDVFAAG